MLNLTVASLVILILNLHICSLLQYNYSESSFFAVPHQPHQLTNAISFDVEHWHSATLLENDVTEPVDHIAKSVDTVLSLLRRNDTLGTFFIVGELAEEYPDIVRKIADAGHEIGSHGHTHTPIFELSKKELVHELTASRRVIRKETGREVDGFRAPNFSITEKTSWAIETLRSSKYRYDSSVFPTKTPMYGVSNAPIKPYTPRIADPFVDDRCRNSTAELVEFPLAVVDYPLRPPIAGGFYARTLPQSVLHYGISRLNSRNVPANLYFHPWEFNQNVRTDEPPRHKRLISFSGIDTLGSKVDKLLKTFDFETEQQVLEEQGLLEPPAGVQRSDPAEQ